MYGFVEYINAPHVSVDATWHFVDTLHHTATLELVSLWTDPPVCKARSRLRTTPLPPGDLDRHHASVRRTLTFYFCSKDLCASLAQAEQNEAAAAQALAQAQQIAAQKVAEAQEQAR